MGVLLMLSVCQMFVLSWALGSSVDSTPSSNCIKGWTGADSGGSCTFDHGTLCGWRNVDGNDVNWINREGELEFDPSSESNSPSGRLRSPVFCGPSGTDVCLEFRYHFSSGDHTKFHVEVCGLEKKCKTIFNKTYDDDDSWYDVRISFRSAGLFEIFFEGKKFSYNIFTSESAVYIDHIVYRSTSCEGGPSVSPLVTSPDTVQPMTGMLTTTVVDSTSKRSRGEDWTTESGLSVSKAALTTEIVAVEQPSHNSPGDRHSFESTGGSAEGEDGADKTGIVIGSVVGCVLLLAIAVAVAVCLVVRNKRQAAQHAGRTKYERNNSEVMVTNHMYFSLNEARPASIDGGGPSAEQRAGQEMSASQPSETLQPKDHLPNNAYARVSMSGRRASAIVGSDGVEENGHGIGRGKNAQTSRLSAGEHRDIVYDNTIRGSADAENMEGEADCNEYRHLNDPTLRKTDSSGVSVPNTYDHLARA